jgi:adenylosuccinate synthase
MQVQGAEFGATTGRKRRTGWLDMVVLRDSARLNGLTGLAITKLDVLTGLNPLKICVAYDLKDQRLTVPPASLSALEQCTPVYEEYPGWQEDITKVRTFADLPQAAQNYLKKVEELSGVPIQIVSVGPDREETITLANPFAV